MLFKIYFILFSYIVFSHINLHVSFPYEVVISLKQSLGYLRLYSLFIMDDTMIFLSQVRDLLVFILLVK